MQDSPFAFCWFIKSRWETVSASIRRIGLQIMHNQFPCELKRDTSQIYVIKSIAVNVRVLDVRTQIISYLICIFFLETIFKSSIFHIYWSRKYFQNKSAYLLYVIIIQFTGANSSGNMAVIMVIRIIYC